MATFLIDENTERVFANWMRPDSLIGAAADAARQIKQSGHSWTVLEPGDSTRYEIAVVAVPEHGGKYTYVVAVPNFGLSFTVGSLPVYGTYDVPASTHPWTCVVIAYFLYLVGGGEPVH